MTDNQRDALIDQRLKVLEEDVKELQEDVKELDKRVSNHDVSIAKIELIVEGLKSQWSSLEISIRQMLDGQNSNNNNAWADIVRETLKTTVLIVGAILGAKIFL